MVSNMVLTNGSYLKTDSTSAMTRRSRTRPTRIPPSRLPSLERYCQRTSVFYDDQVFLYAWKDDADWWRLCYRQWGTQLGIEVKKEPTEAAAREHAHLPHREQTHHLAHPELFEPMKSQIKPHLSA